MNGPRREATTVAEIFGSGMVLQRRKPIRIWGDAHPGTDVTVSLGEHSRKTTRAGRSGRWSVELEPMEVDTGLHLVVTDGVTTTECIDVAIGEVWIAGGQSNMEFHLEFDSERDEVLTAPSRPFICFFDVPEVSYAGQELDRDYSRFGRWRQSTPEDLPYFSAVGFYFAEMLNSSLSIPIGIVGCNWGGTPAAAWTKTEHLAAGPGQIWIDEFQAQLESVDAEAEAVAFRAHRMSDRTDPFGDPLTYRLMKDGVDAIDEEALLPLIAENMVFTIGLSHPNRPGGLFETMLQRYVVPLSAAGVIWYQGESDQAHAEIYRDVLAALIESWREAFHDPEMPFVITQLAPFGGNSFGNGERFPELREHQALVAATVPNTWLASSSDAGDERDIHPKRKRPIGRRLALLALRHVYGQTIACDAPALAAASRDGDGVALEFVHGDGLTSESDRLPLVIVDPQGRSVDPGSITIAENRLFLSGAIPAGSLISFAWTGYYDVDLRNVAGLPALPFRAAV